MVDLGILPTVAPFILRGTATTIALTLSVLVVGTLLAVPVALARNTRSPLVAIPVAVASWMMRGIPPLLVLFLVYFALPQFGLPMESFPAAVAGMTLYMTFYFAEAVRAGLAAVPAGQVAAIRALSIPPVRAFRRIILPQALPATIPPWIGHATEVVKGSALTATIAVAETTGNAYQLIVTTGRPFEILILVAAIYILLDSVLLVLQARAERRFRVRGSR